MIRLPICVLLLMICSVGAHAADELQPISIEYIVSLDSDKLGSATLGKTETKLSKTADGYAVFTKTKAQGLAAILIGSNEQQSCEFSVEDGRAVSTSYSGGRGEAPDYQVDFDWQQRKINFVSGDVLDMPQGYVIDDCMMPFATALLGAESLQDETMYVVDGRKKRIRGYKLSSTSNETIETNLGSKNTLKIELEREFNPARTLTFWLAPELANIPIKMEEKRKSRTTTMLVNKIEN